VGVVSARRGGMGGPTLLELAEVFGKVFGKSADTDCRLEGALVLLPLPVLM